MSRHRDNRNRLLVPETVVYVVSRLVAVAVLVALAAWLLAR